MTSYVPVVKNGASGAILYEALNPLTATGAFQANPTLAAGDVKISLDGGALANLGTLPVVTPAAGKGVKITLSQAETNADNIVIIFSDQTNPAEWCDKIIQIQTVARQIDDLLAPTVSGRTLDVTATGEAGIDWANIGGPTTTVNLSGTSVKTATDVETDTQDIQGRLPAALGANGNIKADIRDFNGTAGTFASGRPEVNTTHWAGTINATPATAGIPDVNVKNAGNTAWASGAITAGVFAADAITAAKIAADVGTEIAAAVWDRLTSALTTVGSIGKMLVDNITGDIYARLGAPAGASVSADVAAVKALLPTALVGGRMDSSVGAMAANVLTATAINADAFTAAKFAADVTTELQTGLATAASISALNNLSAAQVNAEVVDALNVDTYAEPGQEAPGATISLAKKIGFLYKAFRNKVEQTATSYNLYGDNTATVDQKATVSDDGTTFTRAEVGSGP